MPAVANIVLADAQATPVNHTFIPVGQDTNGVWWFEDQSASNPIGYNKISVQVSRAPNPSVGANAGERVNRVKLAIHTPKLEVLGNNSSGITPPPQVAYVPRFSCEFILSDRSVLQDRKDLRKFADFLFANALVTDVVENLTSLY
ncbi:coat protein [ssRNA phage SRR6253161_1]|uniref:Coat protein n=1 Tax=ssRNA phage SRR6253161_1 TaxID=2786488 RepID=A0A8S5KZY2_9VIRU|nr:coat protein [ssRNA phage SRR6253161_1]DAD50937.1 TPA_asm: coat protein [ssRNA phage SRR6253161_1]